MTYKTNVARMEALCASTASIWIHKEQTWKIRLIYLFSYVETVQRLVWHAVIKNSVIQQSSAAVLVCVLACCSCPWFLERWDPVEETVHSAALLTLVFPNGDKEQLQEHKKDPSLKSRDCTATQHWSPVNKRRIIATSLCLLIQSHRFMPVSCNIAGVKTCTTVFCDNTEVPAGFWETYQDYHGNWQRLGWSSER